MTPRCYIQLGRYGDLLIVLRALKIVSDQRGEKINLIVSQRFANILDGVSYINPIVVNSDWYAGIPNAKAVAKTMFGDDYSIIQCHGFYHAVDKSLHPNFVESMWSRTGAPMDQVDVAPLVIDQRNQERERDLINKLGLNHKPILLYNFTGLSSPFKDTKLVMILLNQLKHKFSLIDIGKIKAERFYDLLGLYDIAAGLVTIDTGTLHLAYGSKIQMLAYCRGGWSSAIPKRGSMKIEYADAKSKLGLINQFVSTL